MKLFFNIIKQITKPKIQRMMVKGKVEGATESKI